MNDVQVLFSPLPATILEIQTTVSSVRFDRYLRVANGDSLTALHLYRWNSFLGQSLYWPTQTLEVACRNTIAKVLAARFGANWHCNEKFRRQLSREDSAKLDETVDRQRRDKKMRHLPVDAIVADLPFGFWTSMLTAHYNVPLTWQRNLPIAFPHMPSRFPLHSVHRPMEDTRILRNRISHHEPIFDRRLDLSYGDILRVLGWICPASQRYVEHTSSFPETWRGCPIHDVRGAATRAGLEFAASL